MTESILQQTMPECDDGDQFIEDLTDAMEEINYNGDMFFALQQLHGGLMKGHVNINDPDEKNVPASTQATTFTFTPFDDFEDFESVAMETARLCGTSLSLESHFTGAGDNKSISLALEEIREKTKEILSTVFESMIKMIKRIIEWFRGSKEKKSEIASNVTGSGMSKIMRFFKEALTGKSFSSLSKEERDDLVSLVSNMPYEEKMWFFNGRNVEDRLKIAADAHVHKLFSGDTLIHMLYEYDDILKHKEGDVKEEIKAVSDKYDFVLTNDALREMNKHDTKSEVAIHDLMDIPKIFASLDDQHRLIVDMSFANNPKLDQKLLAYQDGWLKELEKLARETKPDADAVYIREVRGQQLGLVKLYADVQNQILNAIIGYYKAALRIVSWTIKTIESKIKTTDDQKDRQSLRTLLIEAQSREKELKALAQ